jgi:cation diffusion facilitator CzcD-associated flavoprotein CzcO
VAEKETDDVLIVGAGPTGLVLALWLTGLGIRVGCAQARADDSKWQARLSNVVTWIECDLNVTVMLSQKVGLHARTSNRYPRAQVEIERVRA